MKKKKTIFICIFRRPVLLRTEGQSAELRQDVQRQDQQGVHQRGSHRPENEHRRATVPVPTEPDGPVQRSPGHRRRRTLSSTHAARHVAHAQLRQRNG